ncbi:MAG TPA: hypothetical protein VGR76_07640 [Candidatus Angelobacter sp.]|jgi:hypothetical protein|nr:hypothetical protein [Candidatus Angelobacter sp.]
MRPYLERKVTIRLTDLHDLFTQPQPGSARPVSGMQELYDVVTLQTRFLTRPCAYQVTLELPAEQITAGLAEELRPQLAHYCAVHAQASREDLLNVRHQGSDVSGPSLSTVDWVLAPTLLLSSLWTWLPPASLQIALQTMALVVAAVFSVGVAWVAWRTPGAFLPYDAQPLQQELRVYQQLAAADLLIRARSEH